MVFTAVSSSAEDKNRVQKRSADDYEWQLVDRRYPFDEQVPVDTAAAKRAPGFRLGKRFDSDDDLVDDIARRAPTFRLGKRLDSKRAPGFRLGRRAPGFRLG